MEQSKAIINLFHAGEAIPEISGVLEDHAADQYCGYGQILKGSGSDFQKRPDLDPTFKNVRIYTTFKNVRIWFQIQFRIRILTLINFRPTSF
jgi:hypothetical protein